MTEPESEVILVHAPIGRDAALCVQVLARAAFATRICPDVDDLAAAIAAGAGAAIVVEESLTAAALARIAATISAQESWSDFPFIVLSAQLVARRRPLESLAALGNVTLLDRPTDPKILVSAAASALRARRRQYAADAARRTHEEALRMASGFQHRLIGIAGHDLRNPLAAITMSAAMIGRRPGDQPKVLAHAARISKSAQRMQRIIGDLADYSRARVGTGLPLSRRPSDFHRVCEAVLDELRTTHPDQSVEYEAEGDPMGDWDPERLEQILSNLLTNAMKYGAPGAPIHLGWWRTPEGGLIFEVRNQGDPIDPAVQSAIFEPFRMGEQTSMAGLGSLGLGLFIVREIARAHGGDVQVRSSPAEGTTFVVSLPPARSSSA
jgi:signal transduction histidine kinase